MLAPHPRSLSSSWAISTCKRYSFIVRTPLSLSRHCKTRACLVRHREGDFDFRYLLSHLIPYVNNILFCTSFSDPVVSPSVRAQSIHQPEEDLVVWIDFDPHDALCTHIATNFLDLCSGHICTQMPQVLQLSLSMYLGISFPTSFPSISCCRMAISCFS